MHYQLFTHSIHIFRELQNFPNSRYSLTIVRGFKIAQYQPTACMLETRQCHDCICARRSQRYAQNKAINSFVLQIVATAKRIVGKITSRPNCETKYLIADGQRRRLSALCFSTPDALRVFCFWYEY